ncbi:MAG: DNA-binding protein AraC-type, partial [Herbinix sp.]|nr:DNA-binding protein AraC-type [Herbinix sp.]
RWIGALYDEYISNLKHRDTSIDLLMKLILIKISEFMNEDAPGNSFLSYYEVLQKLRKDIYNNPDKNWSVKDMARFCNISPSYLQTLYKQAYQTTCINDVINSKIQFSKVLLVKTNHTIKEIASQCGYHNYEFFMRQFKKYNHCTPSEYREKHTAPRVLRS